MISLPAQKTDPRVLIATAIKKVTSIATLPEVTTQIIKTVEDRHSSAARLHKIVSHDPALISKILKVVNSAFYGLPGQIGSVERAIVLLGLNAVKNIAVAASLGDMFRGSQICDGFTARDLWTHCVSVAVLSRRLAREMKLQIADEAFLAGMIHDLGLLAEMQTWPGELRKACEQTKSNGNNFCAAEREIIGVDHQQLGAALAEAWKFPRSCQLVAGHHHQPAILADNNRLIVTIVFVADTICCHANCGFNLTALNQTLDDGGLADMKFDRALIERAREDLPLLVQGAREFF